MSIRDELTALIARIGDTHVDADNTDFHRQIVDAILSRYGIVELPKTGDESEPPFWALTEGYLVANSGSIYVDFENNGTNIAPRQARGWAAALLAAANRAEAQP